MSWFKINKSYL